VAAEGAFNPANGSFDQTVGPGLVEGWASAAFGSSFPLPMASPILYAARIRARLLLAAAHNDFLIPFRQATDLAAAVRASRPAAYVDTVQLDSGISAFFVHAWVSALALDDYRAREDTLVAPLVPVPAIDVPASHVVQNGKTLTGSASHVSGSLAAVVVVFAPLLGPPVARVAACSGCGSRAATWAVSTAEVPVGVYRVWVAAMSTAGNVGYSALPGLTVLVL
jgi:hypothetical protein